MSAAAQREFDHDAPDFPSPLPVPPLVAVHDVQVRTPAEEARTLVAQARTATLASLSEDGSPWASLVAFAALPDGAPVLMVSTLAEHGRNLARDPRASVVFAASDNGEDPLAQGRVTLAGRAVEPTGARQEAARTAYLATVPASSVYSRFRDFSLYVLEVERVRWVGGYGRMDSADAASYAAAEADPVGDASGAVTHLNDDHADALLNMAQILGGYTDATAARCMGADRYGLELSVMTPRGSALIRVGFDEPLQDAAELRGATVTLARRAGEQLG